MNSNKETGSYYTPREVIDFMLDYLKKKGQIFTSVLEPSSGDGRFLSGLLPLSTQVKAIELFEDKVAQIKKTYTSENLVVEQHNFLEFARCTQERFSLIIGNPPYINPKVMKKEDIEVARQLCRSEGIDASAMQNMWLAFVVGSSRLLENGGTIFFVLPMEFLQVQYAEKLREYLEKRFHIIHLICFENAIFPDIEQDVCLVYMKKEMTAEPYISYEKYENASSRKMIYNNVIKKNKPLRKWTNAILEDEDIALLKKVTVKYSIIEELGSCAPGIVTGGNKFFILSKDQVEKYKCENYVIPILQKSSFVAENTIILDNDTVETLIEKKKPMFLLDLAGFEEGELPQELRAYLELLKEEEIGGTKLPKRFKCANRKPWYGVPIVNKGEIVFFKRYHKVPRVYINQIDIHTTDAGYHIRLNEAFNRESVVFCFYNSLTLAQCEFEGRYYGGGVSELVPSEFKKLAIPYRNIEKSDVEKLNQMFKENKSLETIVSFVNEKTIAKDMNKKDVEKLEQIRKRLIERRMGKRRV
jgi:adenine-specific DNA-methyltransferase